MTFEQFERFVKGLNSFYQRQEDLDNALDPFNSSWTIIEFCPEITNSIFNFIKEDFNDDVDWFGYWYFELEQGALWAENSCTEADGSMIKMQTIEDIYQYLTKTKDLN